MKILLVKLSALGDVVQSLPVLAALKEAGHEVHWIVEEPAAELLQDHPLLDRLFVSKRRIWLSRLPRQIRRVAREIRDFVQSLRQEEYDLVLDLQGLLKSACWVGLARARVKMGFANHREGSTHFYNFLLPPYDPDWHAVWRYLSPLALLGLKVETPSFVLPPLPENLPRRLKLPQPYVVLIPCTRWPTKLWEEASWATLSGLLWEKGLFPVFVGSKADQSYIGRIFAFSATRGRSLCGQLSLLELAALLKQAHLVVSVDTGPMHLAAAVGSRVVALFGPTAPWRTGPFGTQHLIFRAGLPCSPCFQRTCSTRLCMRKISPETICKIL